MIVIHNSYRYFSDGEVTLFSAHLQPQTELNGSKMTYRMAELTYIN